MFRTYQYRNLLALLALPALTHCYSGIDPTADTTSASTSASSGDVPDDDGVPEANGDGIDAYILGLGHLSLKEEQPPMQVECEEGQCMENTDSCVYTYYETTKHFGDFVAFSPNSAVLWPGAIVDGLSASTGTLTSITLPRDPMTFSISLENLGGSPVGVMEQPSLSSFREARNQMLAAGITGKTPASYSFEMSQVYSAEELSLTIDTNVKWPGGSKVSAMFDFAKESSSNKILVDFTQAFYTIDVDVPATPSDLFAPEVTLDEVQAFMDVGRPPMYVQSITYGRRAIFSVETEHSASTVQAAFDAVIKAGVKGETSVELEHQKVLDSLTLKVFILGGSGEDAVLAVSGFQGLLDYIRRGADFSAESPGAPVAYKLAYLDNTGTTFAYTTDYAEANCTGEMRVRIQGKELLVHGNGEAHGDGEMKWHVYVDGSGPECVLMYQPTTKDTADGESIPIQQSCDMVFPTDAPASLTVHVIAEELGGGLFDSDKKASNAYVYTFDPTLKTWTPKLPVDTSLWATYKNLSVELKYAIDLDQ